ncbi:MAG: hypothetical protein QNI88_08990 [Desulfobacterales bacterium]|nr:hypothetical protein [Desulfobacterales bacterium]
MLGDDWVSPPHANKKKDRDKDRNVIKNFTEFTFMDENFITYNFSLFGAIRLNQKNDSVSQFNLNYSGTCGRIATLVDKPEVEYDVRGGMQFKVSYYCRFSI